MLPGSVSFMFGKLIAFKDAVQMNNHLISKHLSDDRCRRNSDAFFISLINFFLRTMYLIQANPSTKRKSGSVDKRLMARRMDSREAQ